MLFCNSGAEANETAFKIARRTGRPKIVAAENAFHGRTMGALALTGQPAKRDAVRAAACPASSSCPTATSRPCARPSTTTRPRCSSSRCRARPASIVPADGYLRAARDITAERGALLVLDEVQTGVGRTGLWFAHQRTDVVPDVVTLAKGLGGGLPIGACIGVGAAGDLLGPGQHGTTFGGNPVCCAAALAVLDTIDADGLLERADALGRDLAARIEGLRPRRWSTTSTPSASSSASRCTEPISAQVTAAAREAGYLINNAVPGRCGSRRRWWSPTSRSTASSPPCPALLDQGAAAPRRRARDPCRRPALPATSCATTTSPRPSRPRCSSWPRR